MKNIKMNQIGEKKIFNPLKVVENYLYQKENR